MGEPSRRGRGWAAAIAAAALGLLALAPGVAANTFHVTRTNDPSPNGCRRHDCSLREAVIKANNHPGADKVVLEAKTYRLTREGDGEDASATGDLDALDNLKVTGRAPSRTAIKGDWATDADRLFDIPGASTGLRIFGVTLRDGEGDSSNLGAAVNVLPGTSLTLKRARVTRNPSAYGAIENEGVAHLRRVKFDHNDASDCCSAFYNEPGATAKLTDVIIDRNTAVADTGAMYSDGTEATLKNVTFSRNHSGFQGGALISSGGPLNITDSTFSGNSSDYNGGAIETESGSTTNLNNVTITRNTADADDDGDGDGGGIHLSGGTLNIQNSILAANTDRGGEAPNCAPGFISDGHNLFGDESGCSLLVPIGGGDVFTSNPRLAPLADNGGFTETVALKRHSPAINHGSSSPPGSGGDACAKRDQRNVKRPQGPRCDIGAFERRRHQPH